jgi:hypothetical protein
MIGNPEASVLRENGDTRFAATEVLPPLLPPTQQGQILPPRRQIEGNFSSKTAGYKLGLKNWDTPHRMN